ncbi:MAG: alpha/beta hydrolase [Propionicimonas sp.]
MHHYSHHGMTFPVTDTGPDVADNAHSVVLLHGFPENRASWQDVSAGVNRAAFRTLAPDLRGLPEGARPRRRRDYRVERLVEDVEALLDAAGLASAHLVGHDWGGGIAWEVALRRPERVLSLTVLSTPHPSALLWSMMRSAQLLRSWYMLALQVPLLPEALFAWGLRRDGLRSLDLPERYRLAFEEQLRRPGAITGAIAPYRAMLLWPSPLRTRSRVDVEVPTTYVWSRRDPYLGPQAARRTAHYCTGPFRFIEVDADHWLPEKEPGLVVDAILQRIRGS